MVNKRSIIIAISLLLVFAAGIWLGRSQLHDEPATAQSKETSRRIAYYKNPMGTGHVSAVPMRDEMGMPYVPVYEDEAAAAGAGKPIVIDPAVVQNIGVRTAQVSEGVLSNAVVVNGVLALDETRQTTVTNRIDGYIEKLHVSAPGQRVTLGMPLYDIYSPDLIAMLEELHAATRYQASLPPTAPASLHAAAADLVAGAHKRLESTGLQRGQLARLARTGEAPRTLTIEAPAAGLVVEVNVQRGQFAPAATPLFRLADLSALWMIGEVYDADLAKLRIGQDAVVQFASLPARDFPTRVDFIYPRLDAQNSTARIRLKLGNPQGMLRPGMRGKITLRSGAGSRHVLVPRQAVLRSGARDIIILSLGNGRFMPRTIVLGGSDADNYAVIKGLRAGETIVTSAQFLLDSESNLQAAVAQLSAAAPPAAVVPQPKPAPQHAHDPAAHQHAPAAH